MSTIAGVTRRKRGREWFALAAALAAIILITMVFPPNVYGHPPGTPHLEWLQSQENMSGGHCCLEDDGYFLTQDEWHTRGDHYDVNIHGIWYPIGPLMLTKSRNNPTGGAVVWYVIIRRLNDEEVLIRCFAPGTLL